MSYCLIVFNLRATPTSWVYKSIPATNWIPRTSKNMSRMLHGYEKYTHVTSGDLRMQDSPLLFLNDPFFSTRTLIFVFIISILSQNSATIVM